MKKTINFKAILKETGFERNKFLNFALQNLKLIIGWRE